MPRGSSRPNRRDRPAGARPAGTARRAPTTVRRDRTPVGVERALEVRHHENPPREDEQLGRTCRPEVGRDRGDVSVSAARTRSSHSASPASRPIRIAIPSVTTVWQSRSTQGRAGRCRGRTPRGRARGASCRATAARARRWRAPARRLPDRCRCRRRAGTCRSVGTGRYGRAPCASRARGRRTSFRAAPTVSPSARIGPRSKPPSTGTSWKNGSA